MASYACFGFWMGFCYKVLPSLNASFFDSAIKYDITLDNSDKTFQDNTGMNLACVGPTFLRILEDHRAGLPLGHFRCVDDYNPLTLLL